MTTAPPPTDGLAIHELTRGATIDPVTVEKFVTSRTFPLVEGPYCTFVWRGAADAVHLRHWIFGLASSQAFEPVAGSDLWFLVLEIPEGSRFEYKIEIQRGAEHELIRDPLNPNLAHDPFGANSVCHADGYATPAWSQADPEARVGRVEQRLIHSAVLGEPRPVSLYFPRRYRESSTYPLLVVHDGHDYLRYAALQTVLDNLIHRLEIPSMVVALIDSPRRIDEYAASTRHAQFLTEELVPQLEQDYALEATPDGRCLLGASLGAVAAFHAATVKPGFFGKLLLQSGGYAFSDIGDHDRGPVFDEVATFVNAFRNAPVAVSRQVFMSCGQYESLIYENRSLVPVLQSSGMDVRYVEARDGHNWENWRDRLREGLSWLFPGPLWMVYE